MKFIVLDSTPLGLLTQRPGATEADACRQWLAGMTARGVRVIVPEIVDYELRRELLRAGKTTSLQRLDQLIAHPVITYLRLTTSAMKRAAQLWADARTSGRPTADPYALDIDVILCAQALDAGLSPADFVVATSNVGHVSLFVPAAIWSTI